MIFVGTTNNAVIKDTEALMKATKVFISNPLFTMTAIEIQCASTTAIKTPKKINTETFLHLVLNERDFVK